jgi:hypothetical protein
MVGGDENVGEGQVLEEDGNPVKGWIAGWLAGGENVGEGQVLEEDGSSVKGRIVGWLEGMRMWVQGVDC